MRLRKPLMRVVRDARLKEDGDPEMHLRLRETWEHLKELSPNRKLHFGVTSRLSSLSCWLHVLAGS